jgi:hypothetical protein
VADDMFRREGKKMGKCEERKTRKYKTKMKETGKINAKWGS